MPITPEDLEPLVDSEEFKALSPEDRGTVLNGALREAHRYVTDHGGWTSEKFQSFGNVANGLRETALSKSVGEHVASAAKTVGGVIKDSFATLATTSVSGYVPEQPSDMIGFGMPKIGSQVQEAFTTNMQKLGKSVQSAFSTDDDMLGNELTVLKQDIDAGRVPEDVNGWSDWMDQRNARLKQAQTKAYTGLEGDTPENRAFAESNSLLGNARHSALLLDYLQTRDPAVFDELRKNVSMTPGRAKLEDKQERIAKDSNLAKLMNSTFGEGAGNYIIEAGDPLEVAGTLLPLFKGAKVVKALKSGSKLKAAGEAIAGAAGETASELGSQFMDDPTASWSQRLQVAKDAFIGSLGLGGLGAGAQMVKDRFIPAPAKAAPSPTGANAERKPSDDLPPPTDLMVEESEQDRMQREGALPPEVEVAPVPSTAEQPVTRSVVSQPFAIPTNKGRAKMAEKILTSQGVDPEAAALMGARLHAQLGDDLDVEEFRAQVLSGFEAGGGVLPGSIPNAYVEDAATYEAQGYSAEESAEHARNAQAANAAAREVAQQQNRDLVTAARREAEAVDSAETEATLPHEERAAPNSAATIAGAGGAADALDRAIDHLTGDAGTVRSERETTGRTGTGGASSAAEEIASAAGVPLMQEADVSALEEMQSGNEHDGYLLPDEGGLRHVLKVTLANLGLRRGPRVLNMTTADYLRRWKLSNTVFGNAAQLVGVMQTPEGVRLVMKQPFVPAADKNQPHPQGREVNRWLEAAGFEYQSGAWVRAEDGVVLNDEHEGNFIKTKDGIRPIDIVMTRLPDAKGPVIPWEQTLQRLRAAGLETTPQSETSAAFNMDAKEGNGGPGASSLKEWKKTTFGQRLKADDRLRQSWRQTVGGNYRVESEAEWQQRANDFIEAEGAEGAYALMTDPDSGLSDSDRVAIGLQLILQLDEAIKQTQLAGGDITVLDDLLYETAEWIEQKGTKLGQAVRVFGMWTRMSAEGVLRTFERKVNDSRQSDATLKLGGDPQQIADDVSTAAKEEREDVAAEALGETTADQLAELQRQVAELRQQLAQAEAEASAAQQEVSQAQTPADTAHAEKRVQTAQKRRQRAQRDLANAEASQQRKAAQADKPRPPGQKKPKQLNPEELAARLIARLSQMPGQQTAQRAKNEVKQAADDYAAGRIDAAALQSRLQALGVSPDQAATLQQLLDVERMSRAAKPEAPKQKRQPDESALSRQAFAWIDRLTFRHVFGGPTAPQATSALSRLIRDYLKAADAASLPDFNTQARALGLPPAEAVELQRLLALERKAHAEIAHARAINRLISQLTPKLATAKTRQRMPGFLKKLFEAHELGALDRPEFLKLYAEAFELPMMDATMRQRIKALIDAQKAAPEGFLKQEATTKLMGELALFKGIPPLDVLTAFWYANVLSGLTTQGVNVWGNAVHLLLRTLTVGATHNPVETWHFIKGLMEGAKRGFVEAKATLKSGSVPYKGELTFTHGQTLELLHSSDPKTWRDRFANGIALGRFVFRALGAGDAFFYHTAREARAWLEAARYARTQEKINGGSFSDHLAEQLNHGPERFAQALEQAKAELANTRHAGSFGHMDRRAWEILESQRNEALRAKSARFGTLATFTQEPEGTMGAIAGLINDAHRRLSLPSPWGPIRVLTPFIPFVNIVANVTSTALDFTPVGIVRGSLGRYTRHALDRSQKDFDADEARDRITSGLLGTLGAGLLFSWAYAMREGDDDEVPFMIYGMGPNTKARRDQMPQGWKPFTVKVGDNYVSYAETPLSLVFAVAGNTLDYLRYTPKGSDERAMGAAAYALGTSPQALLKTGVLSSVNDLFNLMEGQRSMTQVMTRPASGFIPGQGLLRDISELFHGDKIDDTTLAAGLLKDVPVIRSIAGKSALNIFGEPVQLDTLQRLPIVKRMITRQGEDPDTLWLARQKLWIPGIDNQIEVGTYLTEHHKMATRGAEWRAARSRQLGRGAADVLTPEERYQLVKSSGPGIRQAVREMRAIAEQFPEATRDQLQERLNAKIVAQRRLAMTNVLGLGR